MAHRAQMGPRRLQLVGKAEQGRHRLPALQGLQEGAQARDAGSRLRQDSVEKGARRSLSFSAQERKSLGLGITTGFFALSRASRKRISDPFKGRNHCVFVTSIVGSGDWASIETEVSTCCEANFLEGCSLRMCAPRAEPCLPSLAGWQS